MPNHQFRNFLHIFAAEIQHSYFSFDKDHGVVARAMRELLPPLHFSFNMFCFPLGNDHGVVARAVRELFVPLHFLSCGGPHDLFRLPSAPAVPKLSWLPRAPQGSPEPSWAPLSTGDPPNSRGLSWVLLGSPGLSWPLLASLGLSWALLASPGFPWALWGFFGSPEFSRALLGSLGVS